MKRIALGALSLAVIAGFSSHASAQTTRGLSGSTGSTNGFGATSGGFGTSAAGGGATGAASSGFGTSGTAGGAGFGQAPTINRTNSFIGSNAADSVNVFGLTSAASGGAITTGRGGIGGLGGLGGIGGMMGGRGGMLGGMGGMMGGMNGLQQNQNNENTVRATVKLGFDFPQPLDANRSQAIQGRLVQLPLPADRIRNVNVRVVDREAILSGVVNTESDKKMLERLVKLEPGVSKVKNELSVAETVARP